MGQQTQLFEAAALPIVGSGSCSLDVPRSASHDIDVPNSGTLAIEGWAFAAVGQPVPERVFLELCSERTGETEVIPAERNSRPDVATCFGDPGLIQSGFTAYIQLGASRWGRYAVHVVQQTTAGNYRCENILQFSVLPERYETTAREGLARKYLRGNGIEIGALQRKLPVPPHCEVRYVDRLSVNDLRAHYPELRGVPLQPPDVIDDGERLAQFSDQALDFVIANHFLEHCADPISTLQNLLRVLRPSGILYMAIPDKRATFDRARPCTEWHVVKQAFSAGIRPDRDLQYREWARLVMRRDGEEVERTARKLASERYSIHFNVWDLEALLDFLWRSRSECKLPFAPASVVSSENETILVLERS
jgi:SAM-dependent methyltransferase